MLTYLVPKYFIKTELRHGSNCENSKIPVNRGETLHCIMQHKGNMSILEIITWESGLLSLPKNSPFVKKCQIQMRGVLNP